MENVGESSSSEKIMVHTINAEEGGFVFGEFFTINLSNGEITELPYILVGGDRGSNSMVRIGSTVYVVGGSEREFGKKALSIKPPTNSRSNNKQALYHHGMSFIDLDSDSNTGWKSAPCKRDTPGYYTAAVSMGGKIYSFAMFGYACIFDPDSQKWEKLLPPPEVGSFSIETRTEVIADPDNKRLLVFFHSVYFAYYPAEKRWERDAYDLPWDSKHICLAEDGLFFIYVPKSPKMFKVYDSNSHQWLDVRFASEVHYSVWRSKFHDMVYLGTALICLLARNSSRDNNCTPPRPLANVIVSKFKFTRSSPTQILFTSFPVETFSLNSNCRTIATYLPIPI